nr:VanW family protein [Maliibacterium massiliense]
MDRFDEGKNKEQLTPQPDDAPKAQQMEAGMAELDAAIAEAMAGGDAPEAQAEDAPGAEPYAQDVPARDASRPQDDGLDEVRRALADDAPDREAQAEQDEAFAMPQEDDTMAPKRKKKSRKPLWITLSVLLVVAIGVAAFLLIKADQDKKARIAAEDALLAQETLYEGISIDGVDVSGMTRQQATEAVDANHATRQQTFALNLTDGDKSYPLNIGEMSPAFDTQAVIEQAYQVGREGTREEKLAQIEQVKQNKKAFATTYTVDQAAVEAKVAEIAQQACTDFKEPSAAMNKADPGNLFTFTEGQDGRTFDQAAVVAQVMEMIKGDAYSDIPLPMQVSKPTRSLEDIKANTVKIASYSTTFTNVPNRNHNIRKSAETISGTVVQPGETFSFNQTTGNCNAANGYKAADVIVDGGRIVQEAGGGICQTSSTIYNAVVRSDLEIVARRPHSLPSSYVPLGQDATVSWPSPDFKFRNNTDYPIYIYNVVTSNTITCTIYGRPLPDAHHIDLSTQVLSSWGAPASQTRVNNSLAPGTKKTIQAARGGKKVQVTKTWYDANGKVIKSVVDHVDTYAAKAGIYEVGPSAPAQTPVNSPAPTPTPAPTPAQTPAGDAGGSGDVGGAVQGGDAA